MSALWTLNPRRRRRHKHRAKARRRHRSAAQRAATARMLAARFGANPRRRARRSSRRVARRSGHRVRRHFSSIAPGAMSMLKNAGLMGAGAVVVDVGMGYVGKVLPAAASPVNADGTTNWMYFAAKAGLALGIGIYGRRVLPGGFAGKAAEGALAVMAYQIVRGLVPSGVALGAYLNPAPTMRPLPQARNPRMAGLAGIGVYDSDAAGARAAQVVKLIRR